MPGVLDHNSFGFNREVGKMAFLQDDLTDSGFYNFNNSGLDEFVAQILNPDDTMEDLNILSPPPSSNSSPTRDDALPDSEAPMDLVSYIDNNTDESLLPTLSDSGHVMNCCRNRKVSCSKDPFMGLRPDYREYVGTDSPLGSASIFSSLRQSYLDDNPSQSQPSQSTSTFHAWNTPIGDDNEPAFLCSNSVLNSSFSDHEDTLPDTPQSYSGTITGDDSDVDVDIETITDTPKSDLCGYSSSDTLSDTSPSLSPIPSNHKVSILQKYSSHLNSPSKSLIRYNGVSSSASLAENLMSGRPVSGKKRKLKEKNVTKVHTTIHHTTYTHIYYPTGNSVNFHDYAMSPSSCMDYETAQPTVQSSNNSSKRYKRKPINTLDLSEKEKQNHHNQLERNRRQKLADLFIDLRDEIPNITNQSKASKVMILNQATTYIGELQKLHRRQEDVLTKELHRKEFLKKQLRMLEHNRK